MADTMQQVLISARIFVAAKEIFGWANLFALSTSVQEVVEATIAQAADRAGHSVVFLRVESKRTWLRQGLQLDNDDLREMTVRHLQVVGQFLIVHAAWSMVEVDVAETMVDDALKIGDQRVAKEAAAREAAERSAPMQLRCRCANWNNFCRL